ncbi:MAG TPA: DNA polymerase III subunit delta [Candidatus Saccharimonadaceae bacterium]|nr:DNA polymerase III subunit delta [Candidatus Saccharimonadaceae bacterium]
MIYLLTGDNTYLRGRRVEEIIRASGVKPERFDGSTLERRDLPDIFAGQTLFATKRTIIIDHASENSDVWPDIEPYLDKISADTTLIFLETKPDQRTKTYKSLQKLATKETFASPRYPRDAEQFAVGEAKRLGLKFDRKLAQHLVERVGLNPWDIVHALEKLSVLDEVTTETIARVVEANPTEQVFGLFEAALRGDTSRVQTLCSVLALSEEPYRVMGLLATQATQLAALAAAGKNRHVAEDLGLKSEYGLKRLRPFAQYMSREHLRAIVTALADADVQMKSSGEDPWALVEQGLIKVSLSQAKYGKHGRSLAGE